MTTSARRRGLLPSSSFRVAMAGSGRTAAGQASGSPGGLQALPAASGSGPVVAFDDSTVGGDFPSLATLSDADTVSTHSSAMTDDGAPRDAALARSERGALSSALGRSGGSGGGAANARSATAAAYAAALVPHEQTGPGQRRRNKGRRRVSVTVEGNLRAGTLAAALGMPLTEDQARLVATTVSRGAE